jgi:hypothetical protein
MRLRSLEPRLDRPLPAAAVYPLVFVAVYLSHWKLLRLPYYWDEAGYYIPAAYDFFRHGSLIPTSTLSNAHPPLPSLLLAGWWKLAGFAPASTRTLLCFVSSAALCAAWRLALALTGSAAVAFWTALLSGLYPVFFAQSTLAHADMFAAAATLWALVFWLPAGNRRPAVAGLLFALACMAKETAAVTPLALAAWELTGALRRRQALLPALKRCLWLSAWIAPLGAWYAYHRLRTGYFFGNPAFLHYNATATLAPMRVLAAFFHRVLHLTAHMNLFVPVLCAVAARFLDPQRDEEGSPRAAIPAPARRSILWILLANAAAFSLLGGALLTRYLLPMYPLVLVLCVASFAERVRVWQWLPLFAAVSFGLGLFLNPPYRFAPEDNLAYRDVIELHLQAIRQLDRRFPSAAVLSAWPGTDELTRPELGYTSHPRAVVAIEDFTAPQVLRAREQAPQYAAAFVFSTKYDPPGPAFSLGPRSERLDEKYFGLHHDLGPAAIASLLDGAVAWHAERKNQWVAVLHFDRAVVAGPGPPVAPPR